jgi:hypothetical protein
MIRHITSIDNIRNGVVYDPTMVKHGVVTQNRISDLSWWIDPSTHLNLDMPAHLMNLVLVATRLEKGAKILADGNTFVIAPVDSGAYGRFGQIPMPEMRRRITLRPAVQN